MRAASCALLLLSALWATSSGAEQKYTTRFDGLDLEAVLRDETKLSAYVACALDEGPCGTDGALLKRILPEALRTGCARCSERQMAGALRAARFLRERRPRDFAKLQRKYDPTGEIARRLEPTLAGRGR